MDYKVDFGVSVEHCPKLNGFLVLFDVQLKIKILNIKAIEALVEISPLTVPLTAAAMTTLLCSIAFSIQSQVECIGKMYHLR